MGLGLSFCKKIVTANVNKTLCGESFLNAHAVVLFGKVMVFYGNIYRLLKTALFTSYKPLSSTNGR